jgi:CBS domain containing-hemolysin-like protein
MLFDVVLTLVLVLLNGFFVAAEFALVKIRLSQLEMRVHNGSRLAVIAKGIVANLDAYLSACQLGITLASLALGWIGESVVASMVMSVIELLGFAITPTVVHSISIPVAFTSITALHIILGEQAPKWFAIQRPEPVTLLVAVPLRLFYTIFKPFIWVLNHLATGVVRLLGLTPSHEHDPHTAEELHYLLKQGAASGAIQSREHELIENVFALGNRTAKQIMVPRRAIHALDITTPIDELMEAVVEDGYSRLPVYQDTLDNIVGIVYAKDILTMARHQQLIVLQDILRPAYFVSKEKNIGDLLKEFQKRRIHVAIVLDEFGGTAGMVTLEDILEEIVGDILDEYDEDVAQVEYATPNEFVVKAITPISEINILLPVPLPTEESYETLAGLMNMLFGKIPTAGESIVFQGYECTVVEASKRAVEVVRLRRISEQHEGALADASTVHSAADKSHVSVDVVDKTPKS